MNGLYNQTLYHLDTAFKRLEAMIPPPQKVKHHEGFVYRYVEQTYEQALVQKLARVMSGLHAARLLLDNGLLQEQGAMHRILQELHEDILFLALRKEETHLHREYLEAFYQEEFDAPTAFESTQKRPMVSRKKIRAAVERLLEDMGGGDSSTGIELSRTIEKTHSGFVHGASPQIMDMYFGDTPHFHVHGMIGTQRQEEHRYDLYNPFFRAIIAFAVVAKVFGEDDLSRDLHKFLLEFDAISGRHEAFRD
ncbi:MAG TPA: hypothetical protein PKH05_07045 [Nitrospira sp.]|nr:hypothetical protein [Nitrospira sp.]MCW5778829.1 hypothetical protein [Nitrospira sp.]HNA25592.1 hypothetical protein [Nitrospira sp.]HNL88805.1 hypothetical protein [Nitrospira sp.]